MGISAAPVGWQEDEAESGCVYILGEGVDRRVCGAPREAAVTSRKAPSPYCQEHHALCHVAYGSAAEADHLREVEAIAKVVGGRRARDTVGPSRRFLRRVELAAHGSSYPNRS